MARQNERGLELSFKRYGIDQTGEKLECTIRAVDLRIVRARKQIAEMKGMK